ncbi:unnamed protein product [Lymnaea stagnalis]|uniref:Uncharacterized protein n=1 Tax=Lymnaea stagnalis TaxID=6523 RepID=A0AAV2HI21_LYMST
MSYKIPDNFEEDDVSNLKLSEDDEIYLIRVPKGFDIKKLHETKFSPDQITEIEVEDDNDQLASVYELSVFRQEDLDVVPVVKSKRKSACLGPPISGLLCVTKSYNVNPSSLDHSLGLNETKPVEMPPGLKQRYTPFGSGNPEQFSTKKKKRKHSLSQVVTPDGKPLRKKRKIDKTSNIELGTSPKTSQVDSIGDSCQSGAKLLKSTSKRYFHETPVACETAVTKKVKHKKLNHSVNEFDDSQTCSPKKRHKKSKKRHSSDSLVFIDPKEDASKVLPDLLDGHVEVSQDDPSVSGEIKEISNQVKRKLSSGYYSFSADTSLDSGENSAYSKDRKKKRKRKKDDGY